jgi:hypothetical protein
MTQQGVMEQTEEERQEVEGFSETALKKVNVERGAEFRWKWIVGFQWQHHLYPMIVKWS